MDISLSSSNPSLPVSYRRTVDRDVPPTHAARPSYFSRRRRRRLPPPPPLDASDDAKPPPHRTRLGRTPPRSIDTFSSGSNGDSGSPRSRRGQPTGGATRAHSTLHHNYYHSGRRLQFEFETTVSARYQLVGALSAGSSSHKPCPHVHTHARTRTTAINGGRPVVQSADARNDYGQYQVLDRLTGDFRALWAVRLSPAESDDDSIDDNNAWSDMQRYCVGMQAYTHPNLPGSALVRVERYGPYIVMTWPYCARGSAHDLAVALQGQSPQQRERTAIDPVLCVALALSHLHATPPHGQAHGDVRSRNILRTANGRVKLHGLRVPLHDADDVARYAIPKDPRFVAPEMRPLAQLHQPHQPQPSQRESQSQSQSQSQVKEYPTNEQLCAADMYAVGVCLLDLLGVTQHEWDAFQHTQKQQPQQQQQQLMMMLMTRATTPTLDHSAVEQGPDEGQGEERGGGGDRSLLLSLSPFSLALLKGCLAPRPEDRLSAREAVQLCYKARLHV